MALAATDSSIEARIARLESDVGHIRSDIGEMKQDVRDLRARVDAMDLRLSERTTSIERSLASAKLWALLLFIGQAAAVYGTLARTMGWL